MKVFGFLWRSYGKVFAWFLAIMALAMAGICASFPIFGPYRLDEVRVSVWETVGAQGPRWFLFVMGIMFVTVSMPVAVANGVTRRAFYRGGLAFAVASTAAFALFNAAGYAAEHAAYRANGMLAELTRPYPVDSIGDGVTVAVQSFVTDLGFLLTGWIIGLIFYRLRIWVAFLLTPPAAIVLIIGLDQSLAGWTAIALQTAIVAATGAVAFAMIRTVPLKNRKA